MSGSEKVISLRLVDETSEGIVNAQLAHSGCSAFQIPRTSLRRFHEKFPDWKAFDRPGVYFLSGIDDETEKPFVYVGESKNVLTRIWGKHDFEKRLYWTEAVFFNTENHDEAEYLESFFYSLLKDNNRFIIANTQKPRETVLKDGVKESLETFISNTKLIVHSLGYTFLDPHSASQKKGKDDLLLYYHKGKKDQAICLKMDMGFVVQKGSYVSPKESHFLPSGVVKKRKQYAKVIDRNRILLQDVVFNSPTYACCFVSGTRRSGQTAWENKDGISLKEIIKGTVEEKSSRKEMSKSKRKEPSSIKKAKTALSKGKDIYHLASKKVEANGYLSSNGDLIVMEGTKMCRIEQKSCRDSVKKKRAELIHDGIVQNYVFTKSVNLGRPSTAANILLGENVDGWLQWKDANNHVLKDKQKAKNKDKKNSNR